MSSRKTYSKPRVVYFATRMVLHALREHPDQLKDFGNADGLIASGENCAGCRKWLPRQYGGQR